jgi:hypothetical protein
MQRKVQASLPIQAVAVANATIMNSLSRTAAGCHKLFDDDSEWHERINNTSAYFTEREKRWLKVLTKVRIV